MSDDGTATAADNAGDGATQADAEPSNAGNKFTDLDMEKARKSWQAKSDKAVAKAATAAVATLLEQYDIDSVDELGDKLGGQATQATEAETQAKALKKAMREVERLTERADAAEKTIAQQTTRGNAATLRTAVYDAAKAAGGFEKAVYSELSIDGLIGSDDDGNPIVLDPATGEPEPGMTIEQMVTKFVADNPNHRRATGGMGGGSQPAAGAAGNGRTEHPAGSYESWIETCNSDPRFDRYRGK